MDHDLAGPLRRQGMRQEPFGLLGVEGFDVQLQRLSAVILLDATGCGHTPPIVDPARKNEAWLACEHQLPQDTVHSFTILRGRNFVQRVDDQASRISDK